MQVQPMPSEYQSVVITLDHLLYRKDGHMTTKAVYSTEEAEQALLSLLRYYGEADLAAVPSTLDIFIRGRSNKQGSVYLYVVPAGPTRSNGEANQGLIVQAVMSTETLQFLISHPYLGSGSFANAVKKLVDQILKTMGDLRDATNGSFPKLTLLSYSEEPEPDEAARINEMVVDPAA